MKLKQNDFTEQEGMVSGGCLCMSLIDIVAEEFNHIMSKDEIINIYNLCNERGILGTQESKQQNGAYAWDHKAVLDMTSVVLGYKNASWEYCARVYIDRLSEHNYISNPNYENLNCYLIFQVKTDAVPGHFKRFTYDPWKFGSKEVSLKSVRYYRRVA